MRKKGGTFQGIGVFTGIGLGVDGLSMGASHIPKAQEAVRGLSYEKCKGLAERALALETPTDIRALLQDFTKQA